MLRRYSRILAAVCALYLATASGAGAVVLWDQTNLHPLGEGSIDLSSNSCSAINGNTKQHVANDVHFDNPVTITTVRIYEKQGNVQTATQAYLWIAPKTGPLPTALSTEVNNAVNIVPITTSLDGSVVVVTASGLNKSLPAGDYWVSLTPRHSLGIFPYSVHFVTSGPIVGDPSPSIVACTSNSNWFHALAPNTYDYAIKIEGDIPTPTNRMTVGSIKHIYR